VHQERVGRAVQEPGFWHRRGDGGGRGCWWRRADQMAGGGAVDRGRVGVDGLVLRPNTADAQAGPAVGHAPGARRDAGHPQVPGPSSRAPLYLASSCVFFLTNL
jgi:hypothetical protein